MTTTDNTALIAQVRTGYVNRISALRKMLRGHIQGNVFCWPRYALGVKFDANGCATVAVEDATVITANVCTRVFTNGSQERARLMPRRHALEAALATTQAALAQFEVALKA